MKKPQKTSKPLSRRDFLTRSGGVAAGLTLAGCSSGDSAPAVHTRPRVNWSLASSYPPSLDTIYQGGLQLVERVAQLTDDRFRIRMYSAGELLPGLQVLDGVQQGSVQMGHTASYYYIGKNPALAFDTTIPFGLTARQQNAWFYYGGGLELMREVYSDFGIIQFPGGNTGGQMGGWFRNEVNSVEDLKGLKMRIPGMGGEVMNRLGVTVQVLAGGDILPALERGAIDATEWVGPYDDLKLRFYKAAKNYYYPGWWEPGPSLSFLINRKAWDQLPSEYQHALEVASAEVNGSLLSHYDAQNPAALKELLSRGVQLKRFSNEILSAAQTTFEEQVESLASADPSYRKIYDAWSRFRAESFEWFGTAEFAYAEFAYGNGKKRRA